MVETAAKDSSPWVNRAAGLASWVEVEPSLAAATAAACINYLVSTFEFLPFDQQVQGRTE